jgi:hypothetical protein
MAHEVVVGVFEHFDIFGGGNAFDHCLEVVLRQVDVARCIGWSASHQFFEVVCQRQFVDFICILFFKLRIDPCKTS